MATFLVVDDSRVVRKVARKILEDLGFNVEEAGDGQEALTACTSSMPTAILLDWNMPVMDGMEFLQKLRATAGGDKPKVIFCTTENEFSRIQAALSAGADEYIMKPFDEAIIRSKLEQVGVL